MWLWQPLLSSLFLCAASGYKNLTPEQPCRAKTKVKPDFGYCPVGRRCFKCWDDSCRRADSWLHLCWFINHKCLCEAAADHNASYVRKCFQLHDGLHSVTIGTLSCSCVSRTSEDSCHKMDQAMTIALGSIPAVRNITKCEIINWQYLQCHWTESYTVDHNYSCNVTARYRDRTEAEFKVCNGTEHNCTVNLGSNWDDRREYYILVNATNKIGHSVSETLHVIGKDAVKPSKVRLTTVNKIGTSSVTFSWKSPRVGKDVIYELNMTCTIDGFTTSRRQRSNETHQRLLVAGLVPSCRYKVTFRCKPAKGGLWSDVDVMTDLVMQDDVPGEAPYIPQGAFESVIQAEVDRRNVYLYWQDIKPICRHGRIEEFRIWYNEVETNLWNETSVPGTEHGVVLQLKSTVAYLVQLSVRNTKGYNYSLPLRNFKIPKHEDLVPLSNHVDVVRMNSTQVQVFVKGSKKIGRVRFFWCIRNDKQNNSRCQNSLGYKDISKDKESTMVTLAGSIHDYAFAAALIGKKTSGLVWSECFYLMNKPVEPPTLSLSQRNGYSVSLWLKESSCVNNNKGYVTAYILLWHPQTTASKNKSIQIPRVAPKMLFTVKDLSGGTSYYFNAISLADNQNGSRSVAGVPIVVHTTGLQTPVMIAVIITGIVLGLLALLGVFYLVRRQRDCLYRWLRVSVKMPPEVDEAEIAERENDRDLMHYFNSSHSPLTVPTSNGSITNHMISPENEGGSGDSYNLANYSHIHGNSVTDVSDRSDLSEVPVQDESISSPKALPQSVSTASASGCYADAAVHGDHPELQFDPYTALPQRTDKAFDVPDLQLTGGTADTDSGPHSRDTDTCPAKHRVSLLSSGGGGLNQQDCMEVSDYNQQNVEMMIDDYLDVRTARTQKECSPDSSENSVEVSDYTRHVCSPQVVPQVKIPESTETVTAPSRSCDQAETDFLELHSMHSSSGSAVSITDAFLDAPPNEQKKHLTYTEKIRSKEKDYSKGNHESRKASVQDGQTDASTQSKAKDSPRKQDGQTDASTQCKAKDSPRKQNQTAYKEKFEAVAVVAPMVQMQCDNTPETSSLLHSGDESAYVGGPGTWQYTSPRRPNSQECDPYLKTSPPKAHIQPMLQSNPRPRETLLIPNTTYCEMDDDSEYTSVPLASNSQHSCIMKSYEPEDPYIC